MKFAITIQQCIRSYGCSFIHVVCRPSDSFKMNVNKHRLKPLLRIYFMVLKDFTTSPKNVWSLCQPNAARFWGNSNLDCINELCSRCTKLNLDWLPTQHGFNHSGTFPNINCSSLRSDIDKSRRTFICREKKKRKTIVG